MIENRLNAARRMIDHHRGQAVALAQQGQNLVTEIKQLTEVVDLHDRAAHLLTAIGEQRQDQAQRQIELLVTQGLQTIFDDTLSFHLIPGVRAKTPTVDFVVRSTLDDGTVVDTDVMAARGGGLAATIGFLLRLVVLLLTRQRQDTVLFLDETFAHVSADYLPRLIEFLKDLVAKTGVQIVLVTHDDAFQDAADITYKITQAAGSSKVTRL